MKSDLAPPFARPRLRLWHAVGAMILSAGCWGIATVMTKGALAAVPPFALLMIQLGASISFLWIATFATRAEIRLDHGWHKIALSGLLEPGLAYSVGVPGLALTSAASASVIGATEPALTSVLAWILLREKLSWQLAAAIVVAMFGVTLITLNQAGDVGESSMSGNLLIVLGTAFAALYVISSRLLVAQTAPLPLAAMQQTVGFLFALALFVGTWLLGFERLPDALPTTFILLAVLSGIVQYEPLRVCRRLHSLRGWSHEQAEDPAEVFAGGA